MDQEKATIRYGFLDVVTIGQEFYAWVQTLLTWLARDWDLNETELRTLWLLFRESPGLTQSELAYSLQRSTTHISIMLADMKERRLVESERRPPDRRRQYWRVTGRGRSIALKFSNDFNGLLFDSESGQAAADAYAKANDQMFIEYWRGSLALQRKLESIRSDPSVREFKRKSGNVAYSKPSKPPKVPARLHPYLFAERRG